MTRHSRDLQDLNQAHVTLQLSVNLSWPRGFPCIRCLILISTQPDHCIPLMAYCDEMTDVFVSTVWLFGQKPVQHIQTN
jgi:hypothetical protein